MRRLVILVGVLFLGACSDDVASKEQVMQTPQGGMDNPLMPNNMMPPPTPVTGTRAFQQITPQQVLAPMGQATPLKLRYIANQSQPITGAIITFELYNEQRQPAPQGVNGAQLSAQNTQTDVTGEATINLNAGMQSGVMYVKAFDPAQPTVQPIWWNVSIANQNEGGINVTVRYAPGGRYTYNQFRSAQVALFQNIDCTQLQQAAPSLSGAYLNLNEIMPYNDLDNSVSGTALPDGLRLSVTAIIYNQGGAPVAFGCSAGVLIAGGQSSAVEVVASDLPLAFKGVYTALNRFDLINALQESGDGALSTVGDVFDLLRLLGGSNEELGGGIINQLCGLVDIGDLACDVLRGIAGGTIGDIINTNIPPDVRNVLVVISDVLTIVGDLTIVGEIEFSGNPIMDGLLPLNDNRWRRMRFQWDQGCDTPGMCDREVTFNQLGSHSRSVAGVFDAQLQTDGTVSILEHNFAISYGSIILGLMEAWIIPLALGDNSGTPVRLEDLLEAYLPCEEISARVGLPSDSTVCEDVLVNALGRLLRDQVSRLDFPEGAVIMSGKFVPLDENNDLSVDKLDQGEWLGVINNNIRFNGCFTACKGMECSGPVCQIVPR
jgi:hypothetical protein